MQPTSVHIAAFFVSGHSVTTNNHDESDPATAKIAGLWSQFFATAPSLPFYGVYSNYESDVTGQFDVTAGIGAKSGIEIKEGRYLVFKARGPMPAAIIDTWSFIWRYFEEHSIKRCFLTDFEAYGPEGVDIHIGILDE